MAPEMAISGYKYSTDIVKSQPEREFTNINVNFIVTTNVTYFYHVIRIPPKAAGVNQSEMISVNKVISV